MKTDKVELAIRSYDLANIYFAAANLLLEKSFEYMPVVLANTAFSCELYLKALLHGYNIDFGRAHGLKALFEQLPSDTRDYISQNTAIKNREKEFPLCLAEQNEDVYKRQHLASFDEVAEQNYNLSVSTYVEAEDTGEKIDIVALNAEIAQIVTREEVLRSEIDKIIREIENAN